MSSAVREAFQEFCQQNLNAEQRSAVLPRTGFFVVRAGAGSGKTRVITARIVHLIVEHTVAASAIIALTFTNKAAREMRERVVNMLPAGSPAPLVSTFHSFSLWILKRYGHHIGLNQFTILDSADRDTLLQGLIKKHPRGKRITVANLGGAISRHKNSVTSLAQLYSTAWDDSLVQELFEAYESERRAQRSLDFDDLLIEMLRLLQSSATCKQQLQQQIQHILIDEYQDTNKLQHAIVTELIYRSDETIALESLCIVGDENQSIYSWRGATVENMGACIRQFPEVTTIAITQNYRSVQPVLQVANHVIRHNQAHAPHVIWSERDAHDCVRLLTCYSSQQEADIIAVCGAYFQKMKALHKVAVLYRSHFQSRAIEEALVRHSVPYKIIGGIQFYDRQEIKDLLAYVRLAVNPFDRISFTRCINTPGRSLGDVFVVQFMDSWSADAEASYAAIAQRMLQEQKLPARKAQALQEFCAIMEQATASENVWLLINTIITRTNFMAYLTNAYEPVEAKERIANVHELLAAVSAALERGTTTAEDLLNEIALLTDHTEHTTNTREYVQLMTLHSAKGLEFDTVILPGLEDGLFPSSQACLREASLEEERRLFYVGITRARERLIITRALSRFMYGTVHDQVASRFLNELPKEQVRYSDCVRMYLREITTDLEQWLHRGNTASGRSVLKQKPEPLAVTQPVFHEISGKRWSLQEQAQHPTFGKGIVVGIENRALEQVVTVQFGRSIKKIQAKFLT